MSDNMQFSTLDYLLAGNCIFTIESVKTGQRFTYRIQQPDEDSPHFVSLLHGPDNNSDYQYLGTIFRRETYRHGKKSRINPDAPSVIAFSWFWQHWIYLDQLTQIKFHKSEYCCKCGRLLTTPESIQLGIGPVCFRGL